MTNKYKELLKRDKTHQGDVERKAMFHIFSSNEDLYEMVDELYDFRENMIKPECLTKAKLTSSTRALIKLAFNLYNSRLKADVYQVLVYLGEKNLSTALAAMKIRFGNSSSQ